MLISVKNLHYFSSLKVPKGASNCREKQLNKQKNIIINQQIKIKTQYKNNKAFTLKSKGFCI